MQNMLKPGAPQPSGQMGPKTPPSQTPTPTSSSTTWWTVALIALLLVVAIFGYFRYRSLKTTTGDISDTATIQGTPFSNQYMSLTVPSDWALKQTKTGAVNIMKGKYILYINPHTTQASGVQGGRFAEISMGAPSSDAVNIAPPSPACGTSESHDALTNHPRVDLYISSSDKQPYCATVTGSSTFWYFSYITNTDGSYFNYYKAGEPLSYVVTMSYNSKDINSFPVKGSAELTDALQAMTDIVKTMQIK